MNASGLASNATASIRAWLQVIATLFAGVTIGAGGALLVLNASSFAYERAVMVGIAAGFSAFALFVLIRLTLGSLIRKSIANATAYQGAVRNALEFVLLAARGKTAPDPEIDASVEQFSRNAGNWLRDAVSLSMAYAGAAGSIALAVGIVGAVISMAAVVAAHRQVDRMGQQNNLMQQQIFEATATRVSQVFAAQLPSLLDALQKSQPPPDSAAEWIVGEDLLARIQALIYATQPYSQDADVTRWRAEERAKLHSATAKSGNTTAAQDATNEDVRYSPERGQLLSILIAAQFPFDQLAQPLDFSNADLRGVTLGKTPIVGPARRFDLGETILRNSNFRGTQLRSLDLAKTDLSGAVLPDPTSFVTTILWYPGGPPPNDVRRMRWVPGANLHGVIVQFSDAINIIPDPDARVERYFFRMGGGHPRLNPAMWRAERSGRLVHLYERDGYSEVISSFDATTAEIGGLTLGRKKCSELSTLAVFKATYKKFEQSLSDPRQSIAPQLRAYLAQYGDDVKRCLLP